MEFQRGERVNLNFDTGAVEKLEPEEDYEAPASAFPSFVGDILERDSASASPPVAPSLKTNVNGFPAHKKRVPRVSAFKQQRAAKEQQASSIAKTQDAPKAGTGFDANDEKKAIDEENMQRLDAMSEEEIEEERRELMSNLSPALIQRLLARSNIDDGSNERDLYPEDAKSPPPATKIDKVEPKSPSTNTKKVSFAPTETPQEASPQPPQTTASPSTSTTTPTPDALPTEPTESIHFPTPPQPPDLDPNDPSFLQNLHDKYFPTLSHNPNALTWMTPIDPTDKTSAYHPSQTALNASDLRFDFTGALLAPSVARSIPSDRGLHHHAAAPEAAGYTIPELAITARSAVPAQRCVAYQTLGRILYRLGQGEFGEERAGQRTDGPVQVAQDPGLAGDEEGEDDEDEVRSAMATGLWTCIDEGRVVETMTEEAGREKGHLTARTFAQEALWNWRRGGGRKRHAV
ncbi:hypothetical protein P153DRAFT_366611 [Dothidotthia symphoricarpi CBS 119687]|uniref:Transcription factor Rba50 n=1 Tax=Dothidotthia symphoricarpi CBS 119687 TaxID=1392245 RepID=A0A6A6AGV2_9PLEO|nr:uncharacterized protein P153DRAFT_366611 [Dothidotthia symphoricarpi CBS 119687]KAF2130144.1 hypothetical protein P153DRAFT_366611 [Dothidotthia symphoricarpi CBS 119687]